MPTSAQSCPLLPSCAHTVKLERPYFYTMPCGRFPKRVQLWDRCAFPLKIALRAHVVPNLPMLPNKEDLPLLLHHALRPLPQARAAVGQVKASSFWALCARCCPICPCCPLKCPLHLHHALRPLSQASAAMGLVCFTVLCLLLPNSALMCPLLHLPMLGRLLSHNILCGESCERVQL